MSEGTFCRVEVHIYVPVSNLHLNCALLLPEHYFSLLPNLLYAELLSIFDCLTNFPSLPVRSGFDELFPVTTFLTVVQSHDMLISMFLYIT